MSDVPQWVQDMDDPNFLHRAMYGENRRKIVRRGDEEPDAEDKSRASYTHRSMEQPKAGPTKKGDK